MMAARQVQVSLAHEEGMARGGGGGGGDYTIRKQLLELWKQLLVVGARPCSSL